MLGLYTRFSRIPYPIRVGMYKQYLHLHEHSQFGFQRRGRKNRHKNGLIIVFKGGDVKTASHMHARTKSIQIESFSVIIVPTLGLALWLAKTPFIKEDLFGMDELCFLI